MKHHVVANIDSNMGILNAGVDLNGFQPVTLEELIEKNHRFKSEHPATDAS